MALYIGVLAAWACSYSRPFESVAAQPIQPARRPTPPPRWTTSLACRAGAGQLKIAMHSQVRVGAPCMRYLNCCDVGQLDHQRHSGKPNTARTSWRLPMNCFVSCVTLVLVAPVSRRQPTSLNAFAVRVSPVPCLPAQSALSSADVVSPSTSKINGNVRLCRWV